MEWRNPSQKTLLKIGEASAYFNRPRATIYFWYQMGYIDGTNLSGRSLRIFSRSLREFLDSKTPRRSRPSSRGSKKG